MPTKYRYLPLLIIPVFLVIALFYLTSVPSPKEFVENQTNVNPSNLLLSYEITRYPSEVELTKAIESQERPAIGLNVDTWGLKFGIVPTGGGTSKRTVNLVNLQEDDAKIKLKAYGNIAPMVEFGRNDFILESYENTSVSVLLKTTKDTQPGNYSGEIDIIVIRPKYSFLNSILQWL